VFIFPAAPRPRTLGRREMDGRVEATATEMTSLVRGSVDEGEVSPPAPASRRQRRGEP
jgi:hypothetical protein